MVRDILLTIDLNHEASWQKALPAADRKNGGQKAQAFHPPECAPDHDGPGWGELAVYFTRTFAGTKNMWSWASATAAWQPMQNLTLAEPLPLVTPKMLPLGMTME